MYRYIMYTIRHGPEIPKFVFMSNLHSFKKIKQVWVTSNLDSFKFLNMQSRASQQKLQLGPTFENAIMLV